MDKPGIAEQSTAVGPPADRVHLSPDRRDLDLIDQVAEEGRLGEDLDIQERRRGLECDRCQLVESMQPAGGVDVAQRDGEHQAPRPRRQPSPAALPAPGRPSADDVIAVVNRLQERIQMGLGQGLRGRRDQHQRPLRAGQAAGQRRT
jgi:hypothetical protein